MAYRCPQCGGNLKAVGTGFKCSFCSAKYESEAELAPPPRAAAPAASAPQQIITTVEQRDHGVDVFDMNINTVLEITWSDGNFKHSGSGFIINRDGYAITNTHVVTAEDGTSCGEVNVRVCGKNTTAKVIRLGDDHHGTGKGDDLALIKLADLPSEAKVVRFADFDKVRNGERVFVIGNSLGYGTCITNGIVSDRSRNVNGKTLLMTDCAVNGGNSGGPVFNDRGEVIGAIVSGISDAEGMNFAIPTTTVKGFITAAQVYIG